MPTTILSLPTELRLKIYGYVLTTTPSSTLSTAGHSSLTAPTISFRPQRKIGWNRPHADLSNPALLFSSPADSHPSLHALFHSKYTRADHAVILTFVLQHPNVRVLVLEHADLIALQRLGNATRLPSVAMSLSERARTFAVIVRENLRNLDFTDRLDGVVCYPDDLARFLRCLPGLKRVYLRSGVWQRYSGCIEEHIEFAKDRAKREIEIREKLGVEGRWMDAKSGDRVSPVDLDNVRDSADEFRRLSLRSPMTDGTRMTISPALLGDLGYGQSGDNRRPWVVVDLSMIVWQHFLYSGVPYKDHWRCVVMEKLLQLADKKKFDVVFGLRNVEFDPSSDGGNHRHHLMYTGAGRQPRSERLKLQTGMFRAEMSTSDWILRLKSRGTSGVDAEFTVRQRKNFNEVVSQEGCGLVRCRHTRRESWTACPHCVKAVEAIKD